MKKIDILLLVLFLSVQVSYSQPNVHFSVYPGEMAYDLKEACIYKIIYSNNVTETLSFAQLVSSFTSSQAFCASVKEMKIYPAGDYKDFFKPTPMRCFNLTEGGSITLPHRYLVSNDNYLNSKKISGFDGYNPGLLPQIPLYIVDNEYSRMLEELKDFLCKNIGDEDLATKLTISGAAVPSIAEYREVQSQKVFCKLLYNPAILEDLCKSRPVMIGVLLHEIGHLFLQHDLDSNTTNLENELAADEYAGKHIYDFVSDTSQACMMLTMVSDTIHNEYYPEKSERRKAILKGWREKDLFVKDKQRKDNEQKLSLINGMIQSLIVLGDQVNSGSITEDELKEQMTVINESIKNITCSDCKVELNNLFAYYSFKSGKFWNKRKDFKESAHYYDQVALVKPWFYYECGEAYFLAKDYELALESFIKADTGGFTLAKRRNLHLMAGMCYMGISEKDKANALNQLTISINLGIKSPEAYEKRGELKQEVADSIQPALMDYYSALSLVRDTNEIIRINKKITQLSQVAYDAAVSNKKQNPQFSIRLLNYLLQKPAHIKHTDLNYQISDCFFILYNINKAINYLDSVILSSSLQIGLLPDHYLSRLLRGKALYAKAQSNPSGSEERLALDDFSLIPDSGKEVFDEAVYYQVLILVKMDEVRDQYCRIYNLYTRAGKGPWKDLVKPILCDNLDKLDKLKCVVKKEYKEIRKFCP
jgi:tetratricopeptide (TPR) repeat protein